MLVVIKIFYDLYIDISFSRYRPALPSNKHFNPKISLSHSIRSSNRQCVQMAGT